MIDASLVAKNIKNASEQFPTHAEAAAQIARLTDALHAARAHPDFEYCTTECGRKAYVDPGLEAEGWEENIYGGDLHSSWERFDYTEDHYWRRRKPATSKPGADHG